MKYYVRCRTCQARRVFKRHPDSYIRLPKCKTCGTSHKGYLVVKKPKSITCYCFGYPYPHRYLSPNCIERVVAINTDQNWQIFKTQPPVHGVIHQRGKQ